MFDTNDFDAAHECPFDDVEVPEALMDDPWFADVDAALDGLADVDSGVLERLAGLRPDASVVARLVAVDRGAMSPEDAVTFTVVVERVMAWLSSVQDEAILAAGSGHTQVQEPVVLDPRPDRLGQTRLRIEDVVREELAAAARWSLNHCHDRLVRARLLAAGLPRVRASLAEGRISSAHVQVMAEQAKRLPGAVAVLAGDATAAEREQFTEACRAFETRVLPTAERDTPSQARTAARRAVLAIDGEGEARRRAAARAVRGAFVFAEDDGLALFAVRMATEQAHACLAAVDALAHDDRFLSECDATIGERRAEAAAALMLNGGNDERPSTIPEPRLRAHLDITIDLPALLALRDGLADPEGSADAGVADIAGAGAVSPEVIRGLLADPDVAVTMRRLVTDPATGHLLDYGRRTYDVPDRLREFLTARDGTCRFPSCTRTAARCHMDHARAWADGGGTSPANLGALCVRHHQLKTHAGWSIVNAHPDGSCGWISPQGREYQHEPKPISPEARRCVEAIDRALARHGIVIPGNADNDDPPF